MAKNQEKAPIDWANLELEAFNKTVAAKAESLKEAFGPVTPVVITDDDGGKVVGYFQKPEFDTIMYCMDCMLDKKISLAAEQAFKNCLIEAESDPRISSTERKHAYIKAAVTMASIKMVKAYSDEYKKK